MTLENKLDAAANWKTYRSLVENVHPPFVPFEGFFLVFFSTFFFFIIKPSIFFFDIFDTGVFLQDLVTITEIPDFVDELVNFEKMSLFQNVIGGIRRAQQVPYFFSENTKITTKLKQAIVLTPEKLLELSKSVELAFAQKTGTIGTGNGSLRPLSKTASLRISGLLGSLRIKRNSSSSKEKSVIITNKTLTNNQNTDTNNNNNFNNTNNRDSDSNEL